MTRAAAYPFYSQWESPELVPSFLDGSLTAEQDPRWHRSGAASPAEYAYWAVKICGLACLKMILAARGEPVPPTMRLVQRALDWRAFVPIPGTSRVHGLIYRPFADWVAADYGIAAEVAAELTVAGLASRLAGGAVVIASVHPWVRWPDRVPPDRGGHLVLVTGRHGDQLILNNPSGLPGTSQHAARIALADFARFYAGRGIVITRPGQVGARRDREVTPEHDRPRNASTRRRAVTTLERWTEAACAELGLDPATVDERLILDLTRVVAHRVDRPAAPLTAFLAGLAAGRGEPLAATVARLTRLAEAWPSGQGPAAPGEEKQVRQD